MILARIKCLHKFAGSGLGPCSKITQLADTRILDMFLTTEALGNIPMTFKLLNMPQARSIVLKEERHKIKLKEKIPNQQL